MKYFLHDTSAFNDEKITQLYMNFGYEGIGLFFTILEKLALQEKPVNTDVLKHQLKVGKKLEKCWNFLESIELICSNNGETFNKQLLNFSEKYKIKSEKNAKRISEWRKNQDDTKNVTRYESVCNEPKVNRSKVNRIEIKVEDKSELQNSPPPAPEKVKRFVPPTLEEATDYCRNTKNIGISESVVIATKFVNYYGSNGWKVGKNKMVSWHMALSNWIARDETPQPQQKSIFQQPIKSQSCETPIPKVDWEEEARKIKEEKMANFRK